MARKTNAGSAGTESEPQSNAASEAAGNKPVAQAGTNEPATNQRGADTGPSASGAGAADQVKPKRGKATAELRSFEVKSLLKHDGDTFEVGDEVELSRATFLPLKACGVVEGDWPEG